MNLCEALAAWKTIVGEGWVTTDGPLLARVGTATFATTQRVAAVIRPGGRTELQDCLRVATRCRTPLYPVSTGKNWGYGSRVPPADGCVVVELNRMNRILDFDEELAYITVEPGVTFGQVHAFLGARRSRLTVTGPGSTAAASLVGNALERGIAGGLDGDRVANVCGMEVVLADGSCVHTGFKRFPGAAAADVSAHGVGPALDGLFVQSNLGVVTQMTCWLTARPEFSQYFTFSVDQPERLPNLVDRLQDLKRGGVLEASVGLYNAYKILTYLRQFPSGDSQDRWLSLEEMPPGYRHALNGGVWFGEGLLAAPSPGIGALKRAMVSNALTGLVQELVFEAPGEDNPLVGGSTGHSVASVYWRKADPPPPPADMDPDADNCGVLWCAPVVPFRGSVLARCAGIMEEVMTGFGFEPILGAQCVSMRAAHMVASIVYDRDRRGHDDKALACHAELLRKLTAEGFIPYRLAIPAMDGLPPAADDYGSVLQRLKRVLDPADVLAPGRYDFRRDWPPADGS